MKEHCVVKILLASRGKLLHENNCNFHFYKFSYKLAFIPFPSFCMNEKQEPYFYEVGGLVSKNVSISFTVDAQNMESLW